MLSGIQTSVCGDGKRKSAGITPTISRCVPSRLIKWPMTLGIGVELALPEIVAEDDEAVIAGGVFARAEGAAERGFGAEDGEKFGGDRSAAQANRIAEASEVEFVAFGVGGDVHRLGAFTQSDDSAFGIAALLMLMSSLGCA